jgi:hypothetical protein
MKKLTAMLLCMAVCGATLFAQDAPKPKSLFSAGGGAYFTSDFGGGVEVSASGISGEINTPYAGGGGTMETKSNGESANTDDFSVSGLDIGLLGKYPFAVGQKLRENLSARNLLVRVEDREQGGERYERRS